MKSLGLRPARVAPLFDKRFTTISHNIAIAIFEDGCSSTKVINNLGDLSLVYYNLGNVEEEKEKKKTTKIQKKR